jgi:hypothetical protein
LSLGCKICSDPAARTPIDEMQFKADPDTSIQRIMKLRGFDVSTAVLSRHRREAHRLTYEPRENEKPTLAKRDLAILVRDKMYEAIEALPADAMLIKEFQPAIGNAIRSQTAIDKRETKKVGNQTFILQLAAAMGERLGLAPGPDVIEGEATELV